MSNRWLKLWFSIDAPVDRPSYFLSGVFLAAIKYAGDAAFVAHFTGKVWTPIDYFNPVWSLRQSAVGSDAARLLVPMALWALPFLWIGASMSMRRSVDAGRSPWSALLFFIPGLNWLYLASLCLSPSVPPAHASAGAALAQQTQQRRSFQSALLGVLSALPLGLLLVLLQVYGLQRYGSALFIGAPFCMGATAGYFFNRDLPRSPSSSASVGALAVTVACAATLAVALEGAICVAMALPLGAILGALGAQLGRAIALHRALGWLLVLLAALPAAAVAEGNAAQGGLREVLSVVEVDAPPERIWQHVVSFPDLQPPDEWLFRLGVAAPLRARLEGSGVGAVRRCEFTTGTFVEPITAWEAPSRLAFDVASQPAPMLERSPWPGLHPPHLDTVLRSRRGEFRLIALPGGRTRLEGRTWYTLQIDPAPYWALFSDAFIHRIHVRVLRHIKALAERG